MPAPPLVSVVVLNFNGAAILPHCLDRLLAQTYAQREILVVDNASSDGSQAVLATYAARGVRVLTSPRNLGCPGGRNHGLRAAQGDLVAFIDNDGYADPRWLEESVAVLAADDGIGAVAPLVFFAGQPLVLNGAGATLNRRGYGGDHCFQLPYEFAHLPDAVLYPMGCGMVVRRRILEAMGSFDAALHNYYDDVEVGMWSWRLGLRVVCVPTAWVDHGFNASETINRNKVVLCERNRIRTVIKYFPRHLLYAWFPREFASLLLPRIAWRWAVPWRAWGWNLAHLVSALQLRRRFAPRRGRFDSLLDPSWGAFPPPRPTNHLNRPDPMAATAVLSFDADATPAQLSYGWYPIEHHGHTVMRWTTGAATAFLRVPRPTTRLVCEWRALRNDQEATVRLRRVDNLEVAWESTDLPGTHWTTRSLPCVVPPDTYELQIITTPAGSDSAGRELGVGVARLALA